MKIQIWHKIKKLTIKEISASSIDRIVPDVEHVSNDMAEQ